MRDEEKSREQLVKELKEVRRCIDELAASEARLKKAEEETHLLKKIIVSINESEDLNAAFFAVLEKICRTIGWAYGEVWVPSRNGQLLERSPLWYSSSDGLAEFVDLSEGFKFPVGKGLPGRVWSLKQPVWIKDVTLDDNFLRAHIAMEAGLKAGVAIPILARGEVVAVMAFYMFEAREKDERFIEIVSAVAAQLGLIIRRKKAEEEVRRSEEHFRTMIENSLDMISILNRDGTIQYASPSHERILGYKPEDLTGRNVFDFVHPDDFSRANEAFKRAVENPFTIQSAEFRFRHKDGSWRFLESAGKSLIKNHSISGVIVNSRDINERKKTEEALARSEEQYRSIFDSSQDCICHISLDGKYINMNAAGLALYEVDNIEYVIGKSSAASITENRKAAEDANRLAALGETVSLKYKSRGKKGREIWWDSIVTPIRGADGSVRSMLRISRDITERNRAEEVLRASRERFRNIVEAITDAVYEVDENSIVTYISPQIKGIIGYDIEEILGKKAFDLIHPKETERLKDIYDSQKPHKLYEMSVVHKDGHEVIVESNAAPVFDKNGALRGYRGTLHDVTAKKRMEEELIKVQKIESIGLLAGGIAHDFNNILAIVMGKVTLAKMRVDRGDETFKILDGASKACERARKLTQQLLTFSRGGEPVKKTIYIQELIKESADLALSGSNCKAQYSFPDDLWPVDVDEGQMEQVINNLIINAAQAMPGGGMLGINAENAVLNGKKGLPLEKGEYVEISIQDQGAAMSEEHLNRIFEPYFTTKEKGYGLGLATSYSIIKRHGGHITAESRAGIGNTFHIYLPASKKEVTKKEEIVETIVSAKGKVLVMDDEEDLREITAGLLRHIGYTVEVAKDGAEAIDLYKNEKEKGKPFDAVILDLTIPAGMGGKEAIKELKKIDPDIKAVVSSGYSNDPVMADFGKYGFIGVMAKPYKMEDLSAILNKVITGR